MGNDVIKNRSLTYWFTRFKIGRFAGNACLCGRISSSVWNGNEVVTNSNRLESTSKRVNQSQSGLHAFFEWKRNNINNKDYEETDIIIIRGVAGSFGGDGANQDLAKL